jgi:hypothetical protein
MPLWFTPARPSPACPSLPSCPAVSQTRVFASAFVRIITSSLRRLSQTRMMLRRVPQCIVLLPPATRLTTATATWPSESPQSAQSRPQPSPQSHMRKHAPSPSVPSSQCAMIAIPLPSQWTEPLPPLLVPSSAKIRPLQGPIITLTWLRNQGAMNIIGRTLTTTTITHRCIPHITHGMRDILTD